MPFGSIFYKFKEVDLTTADNVNVKFKNNLITRIGFLILGMPHIGLRLRARKIINNLPKNTLNVLDAGCGSGVYSFYLADKASSIDSIDISHEKISQVKKLSIFKNINFIEGDITKLKFKDSKFDLIICSDVLEHIKDDKKAFSELSRVLKSKGNLLLTVPSDSLKNKETYRQYGHERAGYNISQIKTYCEKNGLSIIRIEGYSSFLAEKLSNLSYKINRNNLLNGLFFYPLFWGSLICDSLLGGEYNGLFFKLKKN
jgi:ubiquinone/menaquinone biosynthesis C-methylase UbiE